MLFCYYITRNDKNTILVHLNSLVWLLTLTNTVEVIAIC